MGSTKRDRHRQRKAAGRPFKIVVCAYPTRTIEPVLTLLKAAVLYGDQVLLHSPLASMLGSIAALAHGDRRLLIRTVLELSPHLNADFAGQLAAFNAQHGPGGQELLENVLDPRSLTRAQLRLTGDATAKFDEFEEGFANAQRDLVAVNEGQLHAAGFDDVSAAFEAGLLSIHPIDLSGDDFTETYLPQLQVLLNDGASYPVFDDKLGYLVRLAVDTGTLDMGAYTQRRSTQAAAAERFLARLPTFPLATMAELLDIRESLRSPLVRFRAEMVTVADSLGVTSLDTEFEEAAEDAWVQRVAPALDELDELTQERRLLATYGYELVGGTTSAAATFAVGLITQQPMAAVVAGVPLVAATATAAARGARARSQRSRSINNNPYYFLHRTDEQLHTSQT